jgi:hypothetical protein
VTIPHDWSIERPPAKENPSGSSGAICLPGSAGTERHLQRHLLGLANECPLSLMVYRRTQLYS